MNSNGIVRWVIRPASVVACLALLAACQGCMPVRAQETREVRVPHLPGSAIDVETMNGTVEVQGAAGGDEVVVRATITAAARTRAEADQRLADTQLRIERDTSRRLIVRPKFPTKARSGDGADFVIQVPDARGVRIVTSNGAVTVRSVAGQLTVTSSNGAITVENLDGDADLDTSNGRITTTAIRGELVADTSNGRIEVHEQHGPVDVDTSNGRVRVALAADANAPVRIDSSNGPIQLTVGPAFRGVVEYDTSNGSVSLEDHVRGRSESPKDDEGSFFVGNRDGRSGASVGRSQLETSNGSIRVVVEVPEGAADE